MSQVSYFEHSDKIKPLLNQDLNPISGMIPIEEMDVWLQEPIYFLVISPYDFSGQWQILGMLMKTQSSQPLCACYRGISTARLQIYKALKPEWKTFSHLLQTQSEQSHSVHVTQTHQVRPSDYCLKSQNDTAASILPSSESFFKRWNYKFSGMTSNWESY